MENPVQSASHALKPYEDILADARKKMDIRTPFSLKTGEGWYFDINRARDRIILTCPPFRDIDVPIFLHYLCHTKILEEGWQFPITETIGISSDAPYYFFTFNRAIDHFFDYYAWRLVIEVFGPAPALLFTSGVAAATPDMIIENLAHYTNVFHVPYPSYIMALDWFSLFPATAALVDKNRERQILELGNTVCARSDFPTATIAAVVANLAAVRKLFSVLLNDYPRHDQLLRDRDVFHRQYESYYTLVLRGTGLNSTIVDYY